MKQTILVADDEQGYRDLLERTLKRAGFNALFAMDGAEGKDILMKTEVDLAILDWNMPRMTGGELASWIRRNPKLRRLPILMLTVRNKPEEEALGFSSGADDYLRKPYTPAELLVRINRLLSLAK
jgi:DNA-binding response OmpR family regulator